MHACKHGDVWPITPTLTLTYANTNFSADPKLCILFSAGRSKLPLLCERAPHQTQNGYCALMWAARRGHRNIVEALLPLSSKQVQITCKVWGSGTRLGHGAAKILQGSIASIGHMELLPPTHQHSKAGPRSFGLRVQVPLTEVLRE